MQYLNYLLFLYYRSHDYSDDRAARSSSDIKPLLSLKLDARDRDNEREERRRPRQYEEDDRRRRSSDDISRDADYNKRRDDDNNIRLRNDWSGSGSYDRHRSEEQNASSRGLVDY